MAPGISVPITVPLEESLATSEAPREDTSTPAPEQHDDDRGGVDPVAGQALIDHVGERAADVGEQRRVVEDRLGELAPHREQAHRSRDALADPVVDAVRPAGGEFRRDQRHGHQEHKRGQDVEEDGGEPEHGGRRRRSQVADGSHRHHRQRGPADQLPGRLGRGGLARGGLIRSASTGGRGDGRGDDPRIASPVHPHECPV